MRLGMNTFRALTRWASGDDGVRRAVLPETWMQGRGAFGGIVSAAGLEAVLGEVADAGVVRSVHTQFLGPVRPGREARCRVEVLRRGRSLAVAEARIEQDDALAAVCTVTLGRSRPSALSVPTEASPGGVPGEGIPVPYVPGVTPQFLQHLDLRWTVGQPPLSVDVLFV
jgi:acyl-CoA thioesterase